MTEGLVRDLRNGEWRRLFGSDSRGWHRRAKELVKKLATQGRLVATRPCAADPPTDHRAWCGEALASHRVRELTGGVIGTESVKAAYASESIVAQVSKLSAVSWWAHRSSSVRLCRVRGDYQRHLEPVLRCAKSIMFIDPYLAVNNQQSDRYLGAKRLRHDDRSRGHHDLDPSRTGHAR